MFEFKMFKYLKYFEYITWFCDFVSYNGSCIKYHIKLINRTSRQHSSPLVISLVHHKWSRSSLSSLLSFSYGGTHFTIGREKVFSNIMSLNKCGFITFEGSVADYFFYTSNHNLFLLIKIPIIPFYW